MFATTAYICYCNGVRVYAHAYKNTTRKTWSRCPEKQLSGWRTVEAFNIIRVVWKDSRVPTCIVTHSSVACFVQMLTETFDSLHSFTLPFCAFQLDLCLKCRMLSNRKRKATVKTQMKMISWNLNVKRAKPTQDARYSHLYYAYMCV